jgi:hypothetical protein
MADKKATASKQQSHCPYCDQEVQEAKLPWCQGCGVKLNVCASCGKPVAADSKECPHCHSKLSK